MSMRLDKFLKVSRIIKRRTVAKEIADKGRIQINGKVGKSSSTVSVGDELIIAFGNKTLTVKVTQLLETTKKNDAELMYDIVSDDYKTDYREQYASLSCHSGRSSIGWNVVAAFMSHKCGLISRAFTKSENHRLSKTTPLSQFWPARR